MLDFFLIGTWHRSPSYQKGRDLVLEMERMWKKNRRETISGCSLTHVNSELAAGYLWDTCSKPITKPQSQREKHRHTDWLKQMIRFSSNSSFSSNSTLVFFYHKFQHCLALSSLVFLISLLPSKHLDSTKEYRLWVWYQKKRKKRGKSSC